MPILYERQKLSKSTEVVVTAQKKPSETKIYLFNQAKTERVEGKTFYTGTKIYVRVGLFSPTEGTFIPGKTINVFRRIDTGTWENISTVVPTGDTFDIGVELRPAGSHTFYAEFAGDDFYSGCSAAVTAFAR